MNMSNLYHQSIGILLEYQHAGGAYIACPNFATYQYAWLRDGSFCAYALELVGETDSSGRFHDWALQVLDTYRNKLKYCIAEASQGKRPPDKDCLHSRFHLIGSEVPGEWGHHQLDGLGTWLWVYCRRQMRLQPQCPPEARELLTLLRDYLITLWHFPCSDCWEENEDCIHPHSLGAVYAGLKAFGDWMHDPVALIAAEEVRSFILDRGVINGQLTKSIGVPEVDASLLSLAIPYHVLELDDPIFRATYDRILKELVETEGGVHRHRGDTYYGGGEWVLLSAWLGWVASELGDLPLARRQLAWVEEQATSQGELPEQVSENLLAPSYLSEWTNRWGQPASPLLWSHAQYLILRKSLEKTGARL
jgi:GH15 family glucan-1,4-alpha-glucosidase